MLEIEIKVKVTDLRPIRERLRASGAALLGEGMEYDAYYNSPMRDFSKTDEALRLRKADDCALLTYKGAKIGSGSFKAREELNIRVESIETMDALLERIGFKKTAAVQKFRESYRVGRATVTLDQVDGLGTFAEIEAAGELTQAEAESEIERIAKEYGIEGERLTISYLELLLEKQRVAQS
jgi:adenylate cyclase class 2